MKTEYYVKVDKEANPEFAAASRDADPAKAGFYFAGLNFVRTTVGVHVAKHGYPLVAPDLGNLEIARVVLTDSGSTHHPLPGTYELGEASGYVNVYDQGTTDGWRTMWALEVTAPTIESAAELFDRIRSADIEPEMAYREAPEPTERRWSWRRLRWIEA